MIRIPHSLSEALAALVLVFLIPLAAGCSSPEDRVVYHLERGREFVAAGKISAAKIEFRSALSFDAKSFAANLELADLAEAEENHHDARFYLRDALATDPENSAVAIRLASLLRDQEPWRSRQLLLKVVGRDPKNATGQLGLSQIELSVGRRDQALALAKLAIELDPSLPGAYWQLGIVYEALLKQASLERTLIDETLRNAAVDAFDGFVTSGGEPEWKARIEQARILSAGSHNRVRALAAARRALESARAAGGDQPKLIAAGHLANVARAQLNRAAYAESTEVVLEVTPRDFHAWRKLAEFREASGGSAEAVYQDLLSLFPDDPEVHVLYARHVGNSKGVRAAIRYFNQQIELGIDGAQLLSALRSYQLIVRLKPQAQQTLSRLLEQYPDHPWTQLEVAKESAANGLTLAAIATLETLLQGSEIPEAFEVLARLERFHHRPKRAIRAARSAVETKGYYDARLHRLFAETLFEAGQLSEYLETLDTIGRHDKLTPEQQLMKAQALYRTGDDDAGRKILLDLIKEPTTAVAATLEFARRESTDPKRRHLVRKLLRAAMTNHPADRGLIAALIDVTVQLGRTDVALRMLDDLVIAEYPVDVRYLRARLRGDHGNFAGALADVDLTLRENPLLPGLIDFAQLLYSKNGNTEQHVEKILHWVRVMRAFPSVDWLTNSRKIAQLHLLHSRLIHVKGHTAEALVVLESAILNLEYTIDTRIDLAYLLAVTETDIDRAIEIASETVSKQGSNPRALYTLGYAYLRDGSPIEALENFHLANRSAASPNPLFRYHESVALRQLGREHEALKAIEGVLALDPSFPQAAEVRQSLKSSIASEPPVS